VLYIGGDRLESEVYPGAGFPYLMVELRGLKRRLALSNLGIPRLVVAASRAIAAELGARQSKVLLGLGSYISVPSALAARRRSIPLLLHEQNANAGLANRAMSRLANRVFGSFPRTAGLAKAEWVGNPIRPRLAGFDRARLRPEALRRYGLEHTRGVIGIVGGSLGAGVLNEAAGRVAAVAANHRFGLIHLTGRAHEYALRAVAEAYPEWRTIGFEEHMEFVYAACDLVIARSGGAVAELTATTTPSILVPGGFGSGGHQTANAKVLVEAGAALLLAEQEIDRLSDIVGSLLSEPARLEAMAVGCKALARPDAASVIAQHMIKSSQVTSNA
jgi:UDP-N-acetylglucosamine--N-acetylmuramyl-(pentapeptide) pyrophosphoryl-undecaprenol N-acetylglucosamine transferase